MPKSTDRNQAVRYVRSCGARPPKRINRSWTDKVMDLIFKEEKLSRFGREKINLAR
jgi:hypothetical protein